MVAKTESEEGPDGLRRRDVHSNGVVRVAPRRVRLPDLDERVRDRLAAAVEHAPGDDDPLAERLAIVLAGQVAVERVDVALAEDRPGRIVQLFGQQVETLGRAQLRR